MSRREKILKHVNRSGSGIEIGPSHNPVAPKKEGFNVVLADACHLPFKKDSFDALLSFAVIHHLGKGDQVKALRECKRVLKRGGGFLISVWRKWQQRFRLKAIYKYFTTNKNEFIVPWGRSLRPYYLFSKKDFVDTLKKAGWSYDRLWSDKMNLFVSSKR